MNKYTVQVASEQHFDLAQSICNEMAESAKARGTGIAKRIPKREDVRRKGHHCYR